MCQAQSALSKKQGNFFPQELLSALFAGTNKSVPGSQPDWLAVGNKKASDIHTKI
jgi:hypothetical protein